MSGRMLRAGEGPASTWSVPNLITIVRILVVPVFLWLLVADWQQGIAAGSGVPGAEGASAAHGALRWWAGALFIIAIATDAIDGHLARSRNLITDLGKLLDPIADKAITGAAFIGLAVIGELPWWVAILILVRELGITVWRLAEARRIVLPAGRGGKAKTILQAVALGMALLPLHAVIGWDAWRAANVGLMSLALVLTLWSGADYLWQAYRLGASVLPPGGAPAAARPPFDDPEHP